MLRPSIFHPFVWARPVETALSRNHQIGWIRVQGLGNNLFTHLWAIRIRGINEMDSQLHSLPQYAHGCDPVRRLAPNSLAGDAHSTIPQPRHTQIISNQKLTGLLRRPLFLPLCRCAVRHVDFLLSIVDAPIAAPVALAPKIAHRTQSRKIARACRPPAVIFENRVTASHFPQLAKLATILPNSRAQFEVQL